MVHDLYLARVKSPEESKYPWDYYGILDTIPGDEAFPPPDGSVCPLDRSYTSTARHSGAIGDGPR
jgi:branched-chain amino acid transport system substrate-binding protein